MLVISDSNSLTERLDLVGLGIECMFSVQVPWWVLLIAVTLSTVDLEN